mmetsp:Transcript_69388/g.140550  ORF Transcript_69388/g.140550 Transcript_69388/m.140550 type:complete len:90 (+) Transcript_69388:13-282(+)
MHSCWHPLAINTSFLDKVSKSMELMLSLTVNSDGPQTDIDSWDLLFIGQIKATARVAVRTTPKSPDSPCDRAARIHSLAGRSHANLGNY